MILEELNDAPHIAEMTQAVGRLNKVEMWLMENMKPGRSYSSTDLMNAAEAKGIKGYALKRAKLKLGVKSRKEGNKWYWQLEENAGEGDAGGSVEAESGD
jgi:hypothetical protein